MEASAPAPRFVQDSVLPRFDAATIGTALAIAAAVELLVLRSAMRAAIHIPAFESLAEAYQAFAWVGRYSYYVAALLLMVSLPSVTLLLWQQRSRPARAAAGGLGAFAAAAVLARAGLGADLLLDALMTSAVALLALVAATTGERLLRAAAIGVFAAAFMLAASFTIAQRAVALGSLSPFDGRWMLDLAEPLALAFALSVPWSLAGSLERRDWLVGGVAGLLVFAFFLGEPATARFLLLWNEGLAGTYPSLVYGLAAGAGAAALWGLRRQRRPLEAAALVLLVAGGVGLHSTYQTGLVAIGLALLAAAGLARRGRGNPTPAAVLI